MPVASVIWLNIIYICQTDQEGSVNKVYLNCQKASVKLKEQVSCQINN